MPSKKKKEKDTVTVGGHTMPLDSPRVQSARNRLEANRRDDSALGLAEQDAVRRAKVSTIVGKPQLPTAVADSSSVRKYR